MKNMTDSEKLRVILDMVYVLTLKEIKVKYKRSFLGYFWSILYPLLFGVIFYFVFIKILKIKSENFFIYVITGMFAWQWFANSVNSSSFCIVSNAQIVKKLNFPKYILPMSVVLVDALHFLISIPVISLFLIHSKVYPSVHWIYAIPAGLLLQFLITYSISLIVSSVNVFFRDVERFVGLGIQMLFFLSPILYEYEDVPQNLKLLYYINPGFYVAETWHAIFLAGKLSIELFLSGVVYSLILLAIGWRIFNKLSYRFAEVL